MTYQQLDWLTMESSSTLSVADSLAKTLASPGKAQDLPVNDQDSGGNITASSRKRGRPGSSRKTSRPFGIEDWTMYSGASLRSGMTRNGTVYPLQPLALLTRGTASGSWPAPRSCSAMSATITPESVWKENRFPNLETVVGRRMWPTPTARDGKGARKPETMQKSGRNPQTNSLPDAVEFQGETGRLNPAWVEWLMGFPIGWTDLKHSETP